MSVSMMSRFLLASVALEHATRHAKIVNALILTNVKAQTVSMRILGVDRPLEYPNITVF